MTPPILGTRDPETGITMTVNGVKHQVSSSFSAVSLNDYLRSHLHLTGTKVMCREGGCGVCIVHVAYPDPAGSSEVIQRSINSCLCPILSCDGWSITTVEGLGNEKKPHPIQRAMTDHYATQCGFCTPGWVMSMYSLIQNHQNQKGFTKKFIEENLDGNICRCTGYRPILDAMKTFATDTETVCDGPSVDIEDISNNALCAESDMKCTGECPSYRIVKVKPLPEAVRDDAPPWYKPTTLTALYSIMAGFSKNQKVYYLVGHTGVGVYNDAPYDAYVDLKGIRDLFTVTKKPGILSVGAGVSLTNLIALFKTESATPGFEYLAELAGTISKTAHTSLRNIGSWGGNLAMKHQHPEFPSDSFTCFTCADAQIFVANPDEAGYSMQDFLATDITGKIITRIEFKSFDQSYFFKCFKIMPRKQNAHGFVNAGFSLKINSTTQPGTFKVVGVPILAIGNINKDFIRATDTEAFLTGLDLAGAGTLQTILEKLRDELKPEAKEDESSPAYRVSLAVSLFYKTVLEIVGDLVDDRYKTAIGGIIRPLTSGTQSFPTKPENWPLTKAIPKLEAMHQCTGEAKFIADIDEQDMVHAAFALTERGNASIYNIDFSDSLKIPGVLKVLTAGDIPGKNDCAGAFGPPDELLASKRITHAGQAVAIVLAETRDAAEEGARRVLVQYSDIRTPIITCQDAIREKSFHQPKPLQQNIGDYDKAFAAAPRKISGDAEVGSQIHFHMETQVAVAYPTEDGLNLEAGTQWIDSVQDAVSHVTGLQKNAITVSVKRNGGGFGAKISKNNIIAAAVGLAAFLTRKPVKMHMSLWDNSKAIGKRWPNYLQYEVGFDGLGKLLAVKLDIYANLGSQGLPIPPGIFGWLDNAYKSPSWKLSFMPCKTNLPPNTYCRAPESTEAMYFMETVMEHVAASLSKPSLNIRQLNFYQKGDKTVDGTILTSSVLLQPVTDKLLKDADFTGRSGQVAEFNKANRWKKRGISFVPQRWAVRWNQYHYNCFIAIYFPDGTVAVSHGGIEIGQGINTKVAQVVAYELGIDLKYIKIQPTTALTNANGMTTGGSVTSELACLAAIGACRELKNRIQPIQKLHPTATWEQVISACFWQQIDLSARAWIAPQHHEPAIYSTYAAMCTEVELDVLTGEYQIRRVDVLHDCGESLSPFVDIGQIEGAIVMGLGYFTSEELLYEKSTGKNLTFGTWKYKPPMANDIPVDLRVELLHNSPNPSGVLRSKLVAEPPLCMTCSVVFALRDAIRANMVETTPDPGWIKLVAPVTVERAQQACVIDLPQLRFKD